MKPILEARDLTKVFSSSGRSDFIAVDHISFQLTPGEILGIIGESGSGKTTIAKLITRLLDVTKGEIFLDGENVTRAKGKELRKVYDKLQMVFQTPTSSFDPRRTLGDGIGERLQNRRIPKSEIRNQVTKLLEQCGLPAEFADRYPHEVSGGQCQRAAIARALIGNPKALILDEVTSALDVTAQQKIIELLEKTRKARGLSYLFICHNLALVQIFCNRALVLYDGKIVEQGTPDEIIMRPQSEYTRRLVKAVFE